MVRDVIAPNGAPGNSPNSYVVPSDLRGDIRRSIPKTGLREYWYPAVRDREIGRKRPKKVRLLGDDLTFFRGKNGRVVALADVCPHRGARLSEGHCHFVGTVTCPYHGWTFNEQGKNVAVLSEGPDSRICGKPGTEARVYPTQTIKGVVFVWMGSGEPAPIEEDVPEDFFRPELDVITNVEFWPVNWEVALENSLDSHVPYLHMNAWRMILSAGFLPLGAAGGHVPIWVGNGFTGEKSKQPSRAYFSSVNSMWPKTNYRRLWLWMFRWYMQWAQRARRISWTPQWEWGHHLPGMFRTGGIVWDHYTRQCVPVDENLTRLWYYHTAPAKSPWQRLHHRLDFHLFIRFLHDRDFSRQDLEPMVNQRYDTPEMLSVTDSEVVLWRRLIVTKHLGGRNAPFAFSGKSLVGRTGLTDDLATELEHESEPIGVQD